MYGMHVSLVFLCPPRLSHPLTVCAVEEAALMLRKGMDPYAADWFHAPPLLLHAYTAFAGALPVAISPSTLLFMLLVLLDVFGCGVAIYAIVSTLLPRHEYGNAYARRHRAVLAAAWFRLSTHVNTWLLRCVVHSFTVSFGCAHSYILNPLAAGSCAFVSTTAVVSNAAIMFALLCALTGAWCLVLPLTRTDVLLLWLCSVFVVFL